MYIKFSDMYMATIFLVKKVALSFGLLFLLPFPFKYVYVLRLRSFSASSTAL